VFDGEFLLNLGFYCIMGDYFVSWVLDGGSIGFYFIMGLLCILGVCWGVSIVSWVSCGFWVLWVCSFLWVFLGFSCGLAKLLLCILLVYLGAPYAFLMKFSYFSKKNYGNVEAFSRRRKGKAHMI
jgi:hypothetical protein